MLKKIIPVLEAIPHEHYVEPFGGGAACLIAKRPKPLEVYNDINKAIVDFMLVLSSPSDFAEFKRKVEAFFLSRALYEEFRATWREEPDRILRVAKWFLFVRQSVAGNSGWRHAVKTPSKAIVRPWLAAVERLPEVHLRLREVSFECKDFRYILDTYDSEKTLFYCDPPYVESTRGQDRYEYEIGDDGHRELVERLLKLKGAVVLSGFNTPIYAPLEAAGWERRDYDMPVLAKPGKKRKRKIESLWIKPFQGAFGLFENLMLGRGYASEENQGITSE